MKKTLTAVQQMNSGMAVKGEPRYWPPVLALLLSMVIISDLEATSVDTPASVTAATMVVSLKHCLDDGILIQDVTEKDVLKRLRIDTANDHAQGEFWGRFQWIGASGPEDGSYNRRLLALTSYQIQDDRKSDVGRYVIWLNRYGVSMEWKSEQETAKLVEGAGIALITKGVWVQPPVRQYDTLGWTQTGQNPLAAQSGAYPADTMVSTRIADKVVIPAPGRKGGAIANREHQSEYGVFMRRLPAAVMGLLMALLLICAALYVWLRRRIKKPKE